MPTLTSDLQEILEQLAAIEHERWSDWQKWCNETIRKNLQYGSLEGAELAMQRWDRQIATPYKDLTEAEKQSDRDQVMRYLPLIEAFIQSRERAARIDEIKQFQKVLRGGKMPIVASLFDNRIATLSNNEGASPKQEQGE